MKFRVTLIDNRDHRHKVTTVVDSDSDVSKIAKNKLKCPRISRLFFEGGDEFQMERLSATAVIYVSCGEPYTGPGARSSAPVKIIGDKSEIDGSAKEELARLAELPGILAVYGMPDLHAGPTGCTAVSKGCLYPHLAGSDIGCGVALFRAGKAGHVKISSIVNHLNNIKQLTPNDIQKILNENELSSSGPDDDYLGTIGFSNHFAEIMTIDEIFDASCAENLNIDESHQFLCVHSGSRHLGRTIFDQFGSRCLESADSKTYLDKHDHAVRWARLNRRTIASRILDQPDPEMILDVTHNSITSEIDEQSSDIYVHRKGAAPTDRGLVLIPGSRGTASYLVRPKDVEIEESGHSVAHGAGRQMTRTKAYAKSMKRYGHDPDRLRHTEIGSYVHCPDFKLLAEEIPEAYKDIHAVISDLSPYVDVIARFRPEMTIKDF